MPQFLGLGLFSWEISKAILKLKGFKCKQNVTTHASAPTAHSARETISFAPMIVVASLTINRRDATMRWFLSPSRLRCSTTVAGGRPLYLSQSGASAANYLVVNKTTPSDWTERRRWTN